MTNYKKINLRKCIVTKKMFPKEKLLRIVKKSNGEIIIDKIGKINGRGIYLKPTLDIYEKLKKNNILDNIFKKKLNNKFYEILYSKIINYLD